MSSESYHWTRQDSKTCQQSNVSSDNFHWTQATPYKLYNIDFTNYRDNKYYWCIQQPNICMFELLLCVCWHIFVSLKL